MGRIETGTGVRAYYFCRVLRLKELREVRQKVNKNRYRKDLRVGVMG